MYSEAYAGDRPPSNLWPRSRKPLYRTSLAGAGMWSCSPKTYIPTGIHACGAYSARLRPLTRARKGVVGAYAERAAAATPAPSRRLIQPTYTYVINYRLRRRPVLRPSVCTSKIELRMYVCMYLWKEYFMKLALHCTAHAVLSSVHVRNRVARYLSFIFIC